MKTHTSQHQAPAIAKLFAQDRDAKARRTKTYAFCKSTVGFNPLFDPKAFTKAVETEAERLRGEGQP